MKIRILDNSIRLRLSQREVSQLNREGIVKKKIKFGTSPKQHLLYSLKKENVDFIQAHFIDNEIRVLIPEKQVNTWANNNEVGLETQQKISEKEFLKILIEKDFKCLTERASEDESDLFPNPNLNC